MKVFQIIETLSVMTANVHESQIDLSIPEVVCYRNRDYFESDCKGLD